MSKKSATEKNGNGNGEAAAALAEAKAAVEKARKEAAKARERAKELAKAAREAEKQARELKAAAKYTRLNSITGALSELGMDAKLEDLATRANTLFVEHGGNDNLKNSTWRMREVLGIVKALKDAGLKI